MLQPGRLGSAPSRRQVHSLLSGYHPPALRIAVSDVTARRGARSYRHTTHTSSRTSSTCFRRPARGSVGLAFQPPSLAGKVLRLAHLTAFAVRSTGSSRCEQKRRRYHQRENWVMVCGTTAGSRELESGRNGQRPEKKPAKIRWTHPAIRERNQSRIQPELLADESVSTTRTVWARNGDAALSQR